MSKKIYYKVVKKDLTSALITGDASIKYKKNKYVKAPPRMKLFVFDNYESAKAFREEHVEQGRIYTCYVKFPSTKYELIRVSYYVDESFIKKLQYWLQVKKTSLKEVKLKVGTSNGNSPRGTIYAREVKLLEEV